MISRTLAVVSLIVFLLDAGAHVATFIDGLPISERQAWPILVAVLVLFFAMLGTLLGGFISEARRTSGKSKEELCEYRGAIEAHPPRFFGSVPIGMVLLIGGLALYVAGTVVAEFYNDHVAGIRQDWEGDDRERYLRTLTAEEVVRFESRELRMFSAMSGFFAFICFTFFTYRHAAPRMPARFFKTGPPDR